MNVFGHYVTRLFLSLAGLDALLIVTATSVATSGLPLGDRHITLLRLELGQGVMLGMVLVLITTSLGLYNDAAARRLRVFVRRFLLAWPLMLGLCAALAWLTGGFGGLGAGSYLAPLAVAVGALVSTSFSLHVLLVWCFGRPFMKRRIIVLGDGDRAREIVDYLDGAGRAHGRCVQAVSEWDRADDEGQVAAFLLKPSAASPLPALARTLRADEIVVAVEGGASAPAAELLDCRLMGVRVVDALSFWEREAGRIDPARADDGWLTFSGGFALDWRNRLVKRATDIAISSAFLVVAAPLMIATALAIRLESPGPIFYRQERVGLNGRPFAVWKFRSMRADAECDGKPCWARVGDDRVTRVGRFIRKVRIDETPQVLNVLVGDMSFIGPRPERPFFVDQLRAQVPHYDLRHRVRPGITGWAQVNYPYGASVEDATQKLSYDLYYLKKNDLLLDFAILVRTVRVVLFADGAR